jgi:GDP-4-dehydro-6-deoxy-D-mannose reductase
VLITGITGFAGSHLADLLLEEGFEVFGTARWRSRKSNVQHILNSIILLEADLLDAHSVRAAFEKAKPDYVFHLAAQSFVPASWELPVQTLETNIVGTANLFEAICDSKHSIKAIQVACSSEEYGEVKPEEVPITEDNLLRPLSPYGVSKVAMDYLAYQYFKSYGLPVVRTRAFNHSGPRRGEVFVDSDFAKQIAEIEKNRRPPVLYVGNLDAVRDFTDVRDVVRAYLLAVLKCEKGDVYNICSGKGLKIATIVSKLLTLSTRDDIKVKEDPVRLRPADVPLLIGSAAKFKKQTGWYPQIEIDQTLENTLDYWRSRV